MGITTKIKNIKNKIREYNADLTDFESQFIIIPYQPSGYLDYSNLGNVPYQTTITDFETYKRYYTGNDAFIVNWKGSVNFDYNVTTTEINGTEYADDMKIKFSVGEYLLGMVENATIENDISEDRNFNYYQSQKNINQLTFRINASEFEMNENYAYYFYKVPEISGEILYKVVSIQKEYIPNSRILACYVLTLESLQDTLSNSGRAVLQNVMPNNPGQGYVNPQVVSKEEYTLTADMVEDIDYKVVYDRYLIMNKTKMLNNPVKKVVVKLFGLAILCFISFIGRKVTFGGDHTEFGKQRLIFPMNFSQATTPTLNRSQSATNNFYWLVNAYPQMIFNSGVFDYFKNLMEQTSYYNSQGILSFNETATKDTNGKDSNGQYLYNIWGRQDDNTSDYQVWTINYTTRTIDTSYTYGTQQQYKLGTRRALHDTMFDTYWTQKNIKVLPLGANTTLNFGWTLGAATAVAMTGNWFLASVLFGIGIVATISQTNNPLKYQGICGLIPAQMLDFITEESQTTLANSGYANLNYFLNTEEENIIKALFKTNTLQTSFQADLTDLVYKNTDTFETLYIGQNKNEDGDNLFSDGSYLLMDETWSLKSIDNDNVGFIIDSFNLQAVFSGEFSIEFLDKNDDIIWTGIFQSEAKWSDNIREINTWKDTSIFGKEIQYLGKPIVYPRAMKELEVLINSPNKYIEHYGEVFNLDIYPADSTASEISSNVTYGRILGVEQVKNKIVNDLMDTSQQGNVYVDGLNLKGGFFSKIKEFKIADTAFSGFNAFWNYFKVLKISIDSFAKQSATVYAINIDNDSDRNISSYTYRESDFVTASSGTETEWKVVEMLGFDFYNSSTYTGLSSNMWSKLYVNSQNTWTTAPIYSGVDSYFMWNGSTRNGGQTKGGALLWYPPQKFYNNFGANSRNFVTNLQQCYINSNVGTVSANTAMKISGSSINTYSSNFIETTGYRINNTVGFQIRLVLKNNAVYLQTRLLFYNVNWTASESAYDIDQSALAIQFCYQNTGGSSAGGWYAVASSMKFNARLRTTELKVIDN